MADSGTKRFPSKLHLGQLSTGYARCRNTPSRPVRRKEQSNAFFAFRGLARRDFGIRHSNAKQSLFSDGSAGSQVTSGGLAKVNPWYVDHLWPAPTASRLRT